MTSIDGCRYLNLPLSLVEPWLMNWLVASRRFGFQAEGIRRFDQTNASFESFCDFKNGNLDVFSSNRRGGTWFDISGVTHVSTTDIHKIQKAAPPDGTDRSCWENWAIHYLCFAKWNGYLQIIENLTKKRMKGMKPATAERPLSETSKLKKIRARLEDEVRTNLRSLMLSQIGCRIHSEELAMYGAGPFKIQTAFRSWNCTCENHYHLNHPVVVAGSALWPWEWLPRPVTEM